MIDHRNPTFSYLFQVSTRTQVRRCQLPLQRRDESLLLQLSQRHAGGAARVPRREELLRPSGAVPRGHRGVSQG